ncbi:MAG: tetratricopeptide repeat protein [Acidobacteriota bacterium]
MQLFARTVLATLIAAIFTGTWALAQQTSTTSTTPATTTPTAPAGPTGGGAIPTTPSVPQTTTPTTTPRQQQTPIFISGNVMLADGTVPPDRVLMERVCSTNLVRSEGYTDSKGQFSMQLGQSLQVVPDASTTMYMDSTQGFAANTSNGLSNASSPSTNPLSDCELRGKLAGYRSSTIVLAGHKAMDSPGVGTIVLYPIVKTEGYSVSATTGLAPKDARKAYEKGTEEAKKEKFENAEKEFRKAVTLHPKFADAWMGLGQVYAGLKRPAEAREAYLKAVEADPNYVYPYEKLYKLAFEEAKWEDLLANTERLLRLNPYEFPDAYYFNGVAHYQLKNWDAAEKSLEQAIEADRRNKNPKTRYVLGLVLVQKKDYEGAAESLVAFANLAPNDPQMPKVHAILDQIAALKR